MSTINRMPPEVLNAILNNIDSIVQLGKCRLVCKRWDPAAEVIMLGKEIILSKNMGICKLNGHLLAKPHGARHIKHIEITHNIHTYLTVASLLQVAFTPKMELLSIRAEPDELQYIYLYLVDVVRKAPDIEYKLKRLPDTSCPDDQSYVDAALAFKNSLQWLRASYFSSALTNEFDELCEFKNLSILDLEIDFPSNITKLESILKNCHGLKKLNLEWDDFEREPKNAVYWPKEDIQQVLSLSEVTLTCPELLLVKYLACKYPNIKNWIILCSKYAYELFEIFIQGIPNLTALEMEFALEHYFEAEFAICQANEKFAKNINIHVLIGFGELLTEFLAAQMTMSVKNTEPRSITYQISTANHVSCADQKSLVDYLGEATEENNFASLHVDLLQGRKRDASTKDVSFYDFMSNRLCRLLSLQISIDRIEYELKEELKLSYEMSIEQLRISNAVIDSKVLPQISDHLPNLRLLTFASCTIVNDHQEKLYDIHLPRSNIHVLSLILDNPKPDDSGNFLKHCLIMRNEGKILGDCYLKITILCLDASYYCKLNGSSKPVQMTAEEFQSRQGKETAAYISVLCERLILIQIELDELHIQLNIPSLLLDEIKAEKNELDRILNDATHNHTKDLGERLSACQSKFGVYDRYMEFFEQDISNMQSK